MRCEKSKLPLFSVEQSIYWATVGFFVNIESVSVKANVD